MNTKKIIQKLVALAEKQQKIITKLAQAMPAPLGEAAQATIKNTVQALVPPGVTVTEATIHQNGGVNIKLQVPAGTPGNMSQHIKPGLVGKEVVDDAGKKHQVSSNQFDVNVITTAG